jgi:hypothetical protein
MSGKKQKYPISLNEPEPDYLTEIVKRGEHSRRERERAQILLWRAAGKTDLEIAELLTVRTTLKKTTLSPDTLFPPQKRSAFWLNWSFTSPQNTSLG